MDVADSARTLLANSRDGRISPTDAASLAGGGDIGSAMLALIGLAAEWAQPEISAFKVGAVGQGESGALYLGANFEFEGASLGETIHAEQAVVANAAAHGETGLIRLAVSAPPCGYCRQFLWELASADRLEILLAGKAPARIADFLPGAFGPADLGVAGGMLSPNANGLVPADSRPMDSVAQAALAGANASYAPYSKAYGGAAILAGDGRVFTGLYLENAAFNPSLPPLQAALVSAMLGGCAVSDIQGVAIAQPLQAKVDHCRSASALLAAMGTKAPIQRVDLRGA
jgi:cytidine deaminase